MFHSQQRIIISIIQFSRTKHFHASIFALYYTSESYKPSQLSAHIYQSLLNKSVESYVPYSKHISGNTEHHYNHSIFSFSSSPSSSVRSTTSVFSNTLIAASTLSSPSTHTSSSFSLHFLLTQTTSTLRQNLSSPYKCSSDTKIIGPLKPSEHYISHLE